MHSTGHLVVLAGLGFLFAMTSVATARAANAGCLGQPGDTACTGHDPEDEGCDADAVIKSEVPLYNANNVQIGLVRNFYSPRCQSVWAVTRTFSDSSAVPVYAGVFAFHTDGTGLALTTYEDGTRRLVSPMIFLPQGRTYPQGNARLKNGRSVVARTPDASTP